MKRVIFLLLILILPLASAECLEIIPAKSSYLAGETFQAEITGDLIEPLRINDIHFYQDEILHEYVFLQVHLLPFLKYQEDLLNLVPDILIDLLT